jgi:uncharacterized protein
MNDAELRQTLQTCRTIAVVGLSPKPDRASYGVAQYLQRMGYRIVPVNPGQTEILGEPCFASLREIPFAVQMVNVFRNEADVLPIAHDAVAIGAQCFWQQLGIANLEADHLVRAAGMRSVMDLCLKIEHRRLGLLPQ